MFTARLQRPFLLLSTSIVLCALSVFCVSVPAQALTLIGFSISTVLVPDNNGGIYLLLHEGGVNQIHLIQHIDASGTFLWEGLGVQLPIDSQDHMMVSDGKGGIIVTWSATGRTSGIQGIWGQRIDEKGNQLWQEPAVLIHERKVGEHPGWLTEKTIADGNSGVIVTWQGLESPYPIYAQKIDGAGNLQWNVSGVQIAESAPKRYYMNALSDERGGVFVVLDNKEHIQINHLDMSGKLDKKDYWFDETYSLTYIVDDGKGGLIAALHDYYSIILVFFSDTGALIYGTDGKTSIDRVNPEYCVNNVVITPDNNHGVYTIWTEFDPNFPLLGEQGYYIQRINDNDLSSWATTSSLIDPDEHYWRYQTTTFSDGSFGIIYSQSPSDKTKSIFIQKIDPTGSLSWGKNGLTTGRDYVSLDGVDAIFNSHGNLFIFSQQTNIHNPEITMYLDIINSTGKFEFSKPLLRLTKTKLEFLTTNITEDKLTDKAWFWIVTSVGVAIAILIGVFITRKLLKNS